MLRWLFGRSAVASIPPEAAKAAEDDFKAKLRVAEALGGDIESAVREMKKQRAARERQRQRLLSSPDLEPS